MFEGYIGGSIGQNHFTVNFSTIFQHNSIGNMTWSNQHLTNFLKINGIFNT